MLKKIISIVFIASLFIGCSDVINIESPRKTIKKVNEFVIAEGRWKALPETTAKIISKINFTSIACYRNNKTCRETISLVYDPKQDRKTGNYLLYSHTYTYQITDWTNDIIKAKWDATVANFEITISLKDNLAEKIYRETKARGSETSNPDIYGRWVLE
jgi:hypothetical protein